MIELRSKKMWVDPNQLSATESKKYAASVDPWLKTYSKAMSNLSQYPTSTWIGGWYPWNKSEGPGAEVDRILTSAMGQIVSFVLYNIPDRDGDGYSAGGLASSSEYKSWIDKVVSGIKGRTCVVIIEPDALPLIDRMTSSTAQADRYGMLNYAVDKVTSAGGLAYLDAGDSNWIPYEEMAVRLEKAGVRRARGFSLNVSHYELSKNENVFAKDIRSRFSDLDLRYVVDCSRNGTGANGLGGELEWCNAPKSGIGNRPTFKTPVTTWPGFDARLWVKGWSSDGDRKLVEADGVLYKPDSKAPPAGSPYPEWAMELYRLAKPVLPSLS